MKAALVLAAHGNQNRLAKHTEPSESGTCRMRDGESGREGRGHAVHKSLQPTGCFSVSERDGGSVEVRIDSVSVHPTQPLKRGC